MTLDTGWDAAATKLALDLLSGLVEQPWGRVSPSVYETGRLVSLAPWLDRHRDRVEFVLAGQRADGGWGGPDGYALVPTLSAVDALLTEARRDAPAAARDRLRGAAQRGLAFLAGTGAVTAAGLPDTPAIEIIIPALVESINAILDAPAPGDAPAPSGGWPRLVAPAGLTDRQLTAIRTMLASGAPVPDKLLHSLEVVGPVVRGARTVTPTEIGVIGASAAATAAWATGRADAATSPAGQYLRTIAEAHGGPVPSVLPITMFERGWVLSGLLDAHVPLAAPPEVVTAMAAILGPRGTSGGDGLPPDADTTSVALSLLSRLGVDVDYSCLWAYELQTHFCTWPGESTPSPTTNAHVLDAFGHNALNALGRNASNVNRLELNGGSVPAPRSADDAEARARNAAAMAKIATWLCGQQQPDGAWLDKWHASPYYATSCCVRSLQRFGGPTSAAAVAAGVDWVLGTQRPDGSWGRWEGTAEETAYALQTLIDLRPGLDARADLAIDRGYRFLLRCAAEGREDPPLWHDKDLYVPVAVVRSAVLGTTATLARRLEPLADVAPAGSSWA